MKTIKSTIQNACLIIAALSFSTSAKALDHKELMWGVKNTGKKINIDLDPKQAYRIQGIAGQDLDLLPAVKGRKVKVAVIDTGIDLSHPDLKNFINRNSAKCEAYDQLIKCQNEANQDKEKAKDKKSEEIMSCREKFLQADENVYPGDCYGWSILDQGLQGSDGRVGYTPNNIIGRPDFSDPAGHGTHVAGAILSVTENIELIPVQVIGVGPNQPLKPFSIDLAPSETVRGGFVSRDNLSERIARAIIYAMNAGAEVINLSLGWPENQNSDIIKEAITEAQNRGIIIVAAAGNDSTSAILRPCQFKNVICVAASRPDGAIASFSNFGFGVDIAAPGVEILSTIPMNQSSIRLPGFKGYDYLSGTSQATPYVTGVVAEMLSRGIDRSEIYARLILGARPVQEEQAILKGPVNTAGTKVNVAVNYKKNVLSGLIDMQKAMQVAPQHLILSADKETQIIEWNRQSADLSFQFKLKNYWKDLQNKNVSIQVRSTLVSEIEPAIIKAEILNNQSKNWKMNEERSVKVDLQIRDNKNPSLSRMPSELSYQVYVIIDGKTHRQFEIKAEVVAVFSKDIIDPDVISIPIVGGSIPQGLTQTPLDEIYDGRLSEKDYFLTGKNATDKTSFDIALMKLVNDHYEIKPTQTIKFPGDLDMWRPRYKMRIDLNGDGQSEYVFGVLESLDKELGIAGPYRNHFFIFDSEMRLKQTVTFDDKRLTIPLSFYWMKVGKTMRPAWIAKGPEIIKAKDLNILDTWGVEKLEDIKTKRDIRLYYLDENFKLTHVPASSKYRIADIIQPTSEQIKAGVLPVLVARNQGTEMLPSYMYSFSIGEVKDGQLVSEKKLDAFNSQLSSNYRNLVDTFADKNYSTNMSFSEFKGTLWSGLDTNQRQRVTLIDLEQSKIFDQIIGSQREIFDAALQVRAGFISDKRTGVFLMTNSEIEYHDLISNQVATRSMNRYSFFGENVFIELHSPVTIIDRTYPNEKLPGLFTTEGSGINKGIKMMVPVYNTQGLFQKIISPARLSFKAAKGCRSLGTPLFMGENSGYAIDYYCGDQMKRLLLKY